MDYTIGMFDAASRQVPVTFQHGGVTHSRRVNAVVDENDHYDAAATEARVEEVASGVANKIDLGVLTNLPATED